MQGTWCDALIVQAVADCQNVVIHIIESHENFTGETLIEPHYLTQHPPTTCDMWFSCIRKSTQHIFDINRTRCSF